MPSRNLEELKSLVGMPLVTADEVYLRAIDEITAPFVVVDQGAAMRIVNKATELLTGYARSELLGKHINLLVPDEMQEKHLDLTSSYINDPKIVMYQRQMGTIDSMIQIKKKDGKLVRVAIDVGPFTTPQGLFVVATIRLRND